MNDEQAAVWEAAKLLIAQQMCGSMSEAVQQADDAFRLLTGESAASMPKPFVPSDEWMDALIERARAERDLAASLAEQATDPLHRQGLEAKARILAHEASGLEKLRASASGKIEGGSCAAR